MTRFVGIKRNKVCVVSSNKLVEQSFSVLEVPKELDRLSNDQLISDCIVRDNRLVNKKAKKIAKELKVALVSNYGSKCGIGTYSRFLYDELIDLVGDYKLFVEKSDNLDIVNPKIPNDKIIQCWKRGESLQELIGEIRKYDPDVILIQHEYGLFPNARYWLALLTQLCDYRVITTMHSIFPEHKDKTIIEGACKEIIVHLEGAKDALLNIKKVDAKVYVIPHGCFPCNDKTRLWNFYKSENTFIIAGFGFRYKAFEQAIQAASILKAKHSDVFLTILFSESEYAKKDHQVYFNELIDLINELQLQDNVAIIRGFQSDEVLNSYLRTNKIAVFPYKSQEGHFVFGASGSARLTMATNMPVISSSIPHFSDMATIKADGPQEIADQLDLLFSNKQLITEQLEKQNKYLEENSWKNTALKFIEVFEK